MSPNTFTLVMCVLLTIGCVTALTDAFKARWITGNQRVCRFLVALGLVIWGWLIYF